MSAAQPNAILAQADALIRTLDTSFRDQIVEAAYADAEQIARRAVNQSGARRFDLDRWVDRLVTSRVFGLPIMLLMLA
ncbi:MAG TPA: ferrous iron transporter B, partial [Anaerolineae bacterium]|nr:ferrous iron transporter B [Anaerolineae bacterium]